MKDIYFKVEFRNWNYTDPSIKSEDKTVYVYYRKHNILTYKEPDKYILEVWDKVSKSWYTTRHNTQLEFFNWIKSKGNPIEEITWGRFQNELMIEELVE